MRRKKFLMAFGAAILSVIFSVTVGAANSKKVRMNRGQNTAIAAKIKKNNSPKNNKNSSKVISISSGFDSLYTKEEKVLYQKIKSDCGKISNQKLQTGFYSIEPIIVKGATFRVEQIKKVICALQNDEPSIFWVASMFSYGLTSNGDSILKLFSIFSKSEKEKFAVKLEQKVSELISKLPKNATDYEKELFFHDYIIDNCTYVNIGGNFKIFTAYGCLVEKVAVCEGYAKAMQLLLCKSGVDCRTIVGARGIESHMWNLVKINGDWYHLDVTWDAGGEWQRYNYFNVPDKIIKLDHAISEKPKPNQLWVQNRDYNFNLPVCNSLKENYFEKNAFKISNLNSGMNNFAEHISKLAAEKKEYLYIKVTGNLDLAKVEEHLFSNNIFNYLEAANRNLSNRKIDMSSVPFGVCESQKVIIMKLIYD